GGDAARRAGGEGAASGAASGDPTVRARLDRLAEDVLAIAPGAPDLQDSARRLLQARDLLAKGDVDAAHAALQEAIAPLLSRAQRGYLVLAPVAPDAARLAGAAAAPGAP